MVIRNEIDRLNIKTWIISFIFLICTKPSFCQRDAILVRLSMQYNNKSILAEETPNYKVLLKRYSSEIPFFSKDTIFSVVDVNGYLGEILQLTIIKANDTMLVRLKTDMNNPGIRNMLMNVFHLEIPFHKGYYEIPYLVQNEDFIFYIPQNYVWLTVPYPKRSLRNNYLD